MAVSSKRDESSNWVLECGHVDQERLGGSHDTPITLRYDAETQQFNAYAGCNRMFGTFAPHSSEKERIVVGMTRMACPDPLQQLDSLYAKGLGDVHHVHITPDHHHLVLSGRDGNTLLIFKRVDS
jgi:heat shock protein HslJ